MTTALAPLVERARALDDADVLGWAVDRFAVPAQVCGRPARYLDGHSLGPAPLAAAEALAREVARWQHRVVGGWNERWLALGGEAAAALAPLLGAAPGSVWVGDSTSVNLVKVAGALLRRRPQRSDVVTEVGGFPTDRYLLEAAAGTSGGRVRTVSEPTVAAVASALDDAVGLVSLSAVDFRTGARADVGAVTAEVQRAGAAVVWDCSHAAGVVPVDLAASGADAAVGCSYKYLNGGPGAPAWLYVRPDLVGELANPLPGWFGHRDPFALDERYVPSSGVGRFAVGTPPVLSLAAATAGLALAADAGIGALRAKSLALTSLVLDGASAVLAPLGFTVTTPAEAEHRGGHVALRHADAWAVTRLAVQELGVVGDFRAPDTIRLGCSPLPLRHLDVVDAVARLAEAVGGGRHVAHQGPRQGVT